MASVWYCSTSDQTTLRSGAYLGYGKGGKKTWVAVEGGASEQ